VGDANTDDRASNIDIDEEGYHPKHLAYLNGVIGCRVYLKTELIKLFCEGNKG
jgi:hypothetical protein